VNIAKILPIVVIVGFIGFVGWQYFIYQEDLAYRKEVRLPLSGGGYTSCNIQCPLGETCVAIPTGGNTSGIVNQCEAYLSPVFNIFK